MQGRPPLPQPRLTAQRSGAIVQKPEGPNTYDSKNLAVAIWQPWSRNLNVHSHGLLILPLLSSGPRDDELDDYSHLEDRGARFQLTKWRHLGPSTMVCFSWTMFELTIFTICVCYKRLRLGLKVSWIRSIFAPFSLGFCLENLIIFTKTSCTCT